MNCINCPSLSSAPPSSNYYIHRHKHQIWPTNKPRMLRALPLATCRALPPPIFLATAAPSSAKLSVLLQTGAVCLVAYLIANFVVPGIILRDLQSKEDSENPSQDER